MKKILLFVVLILFLFNYSSAQIICIFCYDQNDPVSTGVNNLILNGSLENHNCTPNTNSSSFCPNSFNYDCDIANWTSTGGGTSTYASMWTNSLTAVPDGLVTAYFGNDFCRICTPAANDTSCLVHLGCTATGLPAGYPHHYPQYGGSAGISLEQTVSGLITGDVYVLEFWAGGEYQGVFGGLGLFALDVGFGDTLLRCKHTGPTDIGSRYIIEFIASSPTHTIKFTNYGHIRNDATELILDDVKLYTLAELSPTVPSCFTNLPQSGFTSNEVSGCPGDCFDFTSTSVNAITYDWLFPGGNPSSSTLQDPAGICYANPGVYDVTLIASAGPVADTLTMPGYITIFTPLSVTISQNGNVLTCNPAANSYQWFLNGNPIPGATTQSITITQAGTYTVEVTDSNGCITSTDIVVSSLPSPNFSSTDTTLCEKFCIDFFDQSTNNPTGWQWSFPGGVPSSSNSQNPADICYDVPGVYDVTLITTNASGTDTLIISNYITVYATPPFPVITQNGNTLTCSAADFYQWQLNAVDIPGATNQSYTITQSGFYTVVITDLNGCVNSASADVLLSGIEENVAAMGASIYPNPSGGNFIIELYHFGNAEIVSVILFNALGQQVFILDEHQLPGSSGHWIKEIDVTGISGGVYILEIKTSASSLRKKLIIE